MFFHIEEFPLAIMAAKQPINPTWASVVSGQRIPQQNPQVSAPQKPQASAPQKPQASAPQKHQASAPQKLQASAPRKQNALEDTFERDLKLAIELSRQEAVREEAARQEAARQEAARQEAAREEAAHQEAARQEADRQEAARQEAALKKEAARQEAALKKAAARQEAARQEAACQEAARQRAARQEAARQKAARIKAAEEKAAQEEAYSRETSQKAYAFHKCLEIIKDILQCAEASWNVACGPSCLQEACQDIHHRLLRQYYYINIKLLELDQYLLELNRIKSILKSTFDREQYNRCSHKSGECEKFVLEKGIKFDNIRTPEKTCNLYYNFCMSLIRKSKNHKRLIQRTLIKNSVYYSHYLNSETCPINSSCLNTKSNLKTGKCRVHRNIDSFRSSCYCVICFNQYDNNRFYRGKTVSREEFIICEKCHNESNDIT